jgi:hypothetical protein
LLSALLQDPQLKRLREHKAVHFDLIQKALCDASHSLPTMASASSAPEQMETEPQQEPQQAPASASGDANKEQATADVKKPTAILVIGTSTDAQKKCTAWCNQNAQTSIAELGTSP